MSESSLEELCLLTLSEQGAQKPVPNENCYILAVKKDKGRSCGGVSSRHVHNIIEWVEFKRP